MQGDVPFEDVQRAVVRLEQDAHSSALGRLADEEPYAFFVFLVGARVDRLLEAARIVGAAEIGGVRREGLDIPGKDRAKALARLLRDDLIDVERAVCDRIFIFGIENELLIF